MVCELAMYNMRSKTLHCKMVVHSNISYCNLVKFYVEFYVLIKCIISGIEIRGSGGSMSRVVGPQIFFRQE